MKIQPHFKKHIIHYEIKNILIWLAATLRTRWWLHWDLTTQEPKDIHSLSADAVFEYKVCVSALRK